MKSGNLYILMLIAFILSSCAINKKSSKVKDKSENTIIEKIDSTRSVNKIEKEEVWYNSEDLGRIVINYDVIFDTIKVAGEREIKPVPYVKSIEDYRDLRIDYNYTKYLILDSLIQVYESKLEEDKKDIVEIDKIKESNKTKNVLVLVICVVFLIAIVFFARRWLFRLIK